VSDYPHGYGFVYILKSKEGGYQKIGRTCNPSQRMGQISPVLPFETEVEFLFMCVPGEEQIAERLLHKKFEDKRTNGEWFKLNNEDYEWLGQDTLPLPIAISHSRCYCQQCLGRYHCVDHLIEELVGLS